MKKLLVLLAANLVFIVSLAGCSVKSADMLETDSETASVSENAESEPMESTAEDSTSSFLASKENDTAVSSENPTENSSSAATNSTAPKITPSTQATETQAPTATETPAPEQEVAQPPVTEQPKQETVTPPPIEIPQETVPPPEPTPQPTPEPAPPEPPTPDFEVSGYVEQAKSYGQSIGLTVSRKTGEKESAPTSLLTNFMSCLKMNSAPIFSIQPGVGLENEQATPRRLRRMWSIYWIPCLPAPCFQTLNF